MRLPLRFLPSSAALLACAFALAGCATTSDASSADALTFIVVRHAEKATDDPRDPALDAAGQARAAALATRLQARDIVAAYATDLRRTVQTAQPTAQAHAIEVTRYDAATPAARFAARLRQQHASGTVLVVGHSNTVPGIVSALCQCAVAAIDDSDYGNLYEITIDRDTEPVLVQRRY